MRRAIPVTNLGSVRHIVPVWCRKFKLAPQNLFKESLLIFTTAFEIKKGNFLKPELKSNLKHTIDSLTDILL